jgi:hypothetical protein
MGSVAYQVGFGGLRWLASSSVLAAMMSAAPNRQSIPCSSRKSEREEVEAS